MHTSYEDGHFDAAPVGDLGARLGRTPAPAVRARDNVIVLDATERRGRRPDPDSPLGRAVAHAERGDEDAQRYLWARYADVVHAYVVSTGRGWEEAAEITRRSFRGLPASARASRQAGVSLLAWLLRAAQEDLEEDGARSL